MCAQRISPGWGGGTDPARRNKTKWQPYSFPGLPYKAPRAGWLRQHRRFCHLWRLGMQDRVLRRLWRELLSSSRLAVVLGILSPQQHHLISVSQSRDLSLRACPGVHRSLFPCKDPAHETCFSAAFHPNPAMSENPCFHTGLYPQRAGLGLHRSVHSTTVVTIFSCFPGVERVNLENVYLCMFSP